MSWRVFKVRTDVSVSHGVLLRNCGRIFWDYPLASLTNSNYKYNIHNELDIRCGAAVATNSIRFTVTFKSA